MIDITSVPPRSESFLWSSIEFDKIGAIKTIVTRGISRYLILRIDWMRTIGLSSRRTLYRRRAKPSFAKQGGDMLHLTRVRVRDNAGGERWDDRRPGREREKKQLHRAKKDAQPCHGSLSRPGITSGKYCSSWNVTQAKFRLGKYVSIK